MPIERIDFDAANPYILGYGTIAIRQEPKK